MSFIGTAAFGIKNRPQRGGKESYDPSLKFCVSNHLLKNVSVPQFHAQGAGGFFAAAGEVVVGQHDRYAATVNRFPGVYLLHRRVAQLFGVPLADVISLAFDYGRAKGYRAAKAERRAAV